MSAEKQTVNPLEQFVLLAKSAKGAAAAELVKQALEAPGVYVFGELLDSKNIQDLNVEPTIAYFKLLNVFSYGTYSDYKANQAELGELSPVALKKLKHLTIVTLADKQKCIPYELLLKELDVKNLRELEDLIIELMYADIVRGKLDQKNHQLEVHYAIGRDIRPEQLGEIATVLQQWCNDCEGILSGIEKQVIKANTYKENQNKIKAQIETEVTNIKKTLKTSQQQDVEEQMVTDSQMTMPDKLAKKSTSKTKGLRGSGKFWGKSS